ncbi:uncharacterized protein LOC106771576 isoform X2 [Vigna radiata var. radiata]|uniref:Uncharacterized protein LOC106771576 isoform X2 n=1 Tax=Vigna radiata var. radiata TaxID=3916 RepID=A0A3Q0FEG4_VIGRR|nr:uncharacterized protein LOC106771576 isoform X2 [Vigna radiata var. radiata]
MLLLLPPSLQHQHQHISLRSMGVLKAVFNHKIVVLVVRRDVQRHSTRNHVCSSARSVVPSVCVFLLEPMATRRYAPATTTGRPKGEDPNALESSNSHNLTFLSIYLKTKSSVYTAYVFQSILQMDLQII